MFEQCLGKRGKHVSPPTRAIPAYQIGLPTVMDMIMIYRMIMIMIYPRQA